MLKHVEATTLLLHAFARCLIICAHELKHDSPSPPYWAGWLHCETNSTTQRAGTCCCPFPDFLWHRLLFTFFSWHPFLLPSHPLQHSLSWVFFWRHLPLLTSLCLLISFSWHLHSCIFSLNIFVSLFPLSLSLLTFLSCNISVPWHLSHDRILWASLFLHIPFIHNLDATIRIQQQLDYETQSREHTKASPKPPWHSSSTALRTILHTNSTSMHRAVPAWESLWSLGMRLLTRSNWARRRKNDSGSKWSDILPSQYGSWVIMQNTPCDCGLGFLWWLNVT